MTRFNGNGEQQMMVMASARVRMQHAEWEGPAADRFRSVCRRHLTSDGSLSAHGVGAGRMVSTNR